MYVYVYVYVRESVRVLSNYTVHLILNYTHIMDTIGVFMCLSACGHAHLVIN